MKRKQKHKQKQNPKCEIGELPDELLVHILSRLRLKEAAKTSILARRWQYLWRLVDGTLQFDFGDVATEAGDVMEVEKFMSCVNTVLELHRGRCIEGMVVNFEGMNDEQYEMMGRASVVIDAWLHFAVQKQVERFELRLSRGHAHQFPSIETLRSHSRGVTSSPFHSVKVFRLAEVSVKDEVVHHLLASCPNLKELCICNSKDTKNLRVVNPPSLRVLEIIRCHNIQSLEISSESLVSIAFEGCERNDFKRVPNLRELTIFHHSFLHFISKPNSASVYSDQLVKLVLVLMHVISFWQLAGLPDPLPLLHSLKQLELNHCSVVGRSLLFFLSLIKASPQLCEFRIEMEYIFYWNVDREEMPFPAIRADEAPEFEHTNLKVVEMRGFVGSSSEKELLLELVKRAGASMERVVIHTQSRYYDCSDLAFCIANRIGDRFPKRYPELGATTPAESKERAQHLVSTLPHHIHSIVN